MNEICLIFLQSYTYIEFRAMCIISQPLVRECCKLQFYLDSKINLSRVFSVTESKKLNFALFCSAACAKIAQIDFCQQYVPAWAVSL